MKSAFTVLPMSQRFSLVAGGTYEGSVTVANPVDAESDFSFTVTATPYNVVGDNYEADLANITTHSQIANWITIENPSGTLKPNEHTTVKYTIHVPENVPSGGQYATILVSQDNSAQSTGEGFSVATTLQLASVIYGDISGSLVREGTVIENNVPGFSFDPSIALTAIVKNDGNTHSDAIFNITITNKFTGEEIVNESRGGNFSEIIMPETSRFITHRISNLPLLSFVHVNQTIYFNDVAYTSEKDLLICPIWFIFLSIITIISLVAFIVSRVRKHRYKKSARKI